MGVKLRLCLVAVFGFMIVVSAAIFVVVAVLVLRILGILRVLRIFVLIVVFVFHDFFISFFYFLMKSGVYKVLPLMVRSLRLRRADADRHTPDPLYIKGKFSTLPSRRAYNRIRCRPIKSASRFCKAFRFSPLRKDS